MVPDIIALKKEVASHYFSLFLLHHKPSLVKEFINKWICFLEIYSQMKNFVCFKDDFPVLRNLNPAATSLIIVPFEKENEWFSNTSVFPICLFGVCLKDQLIYCKEGLDLLLLYIKISNVKTIAFHRYFQHEKIMVTIKSFYPHIQCYPPTAFRYFCKRNCIHSFV